MDLEDTPENEIDKHLLFIKNYFDEQQVSFNICCNTLGSLAIILAQNMGRENGGQFLKNIVNAYYEATPEEVNIIQ